MFLPSRPAAERGTNSYSIHLPGAELNPACLMSSAGPKTPRNAAILDTSAGGAA